MAKKTDAKVFNVSVIGLSGTEKEKGATGVGKSCLCNRFMRGLADDYHTNHISVLGQTDFSDRVINNDHFLYWGDVVKTDEGVDYTFQVIEQSEFIDDVSFQPFRIGRADQYLKRCLTTKVQSAEKLMYICKEQLGMETDQAFEQVYMPNSGKLNIDGFLCVYDVSVVPKRSPEKQTEFVNALLTNATKMKKPVVLVTTKNDINDEKLIKEAEKMLTKLKNHVPLIETSAHNNVNVELAFMTLAHLMDKTKGRPKSMSYNEAARERKEVLDVATEAYNNLLRVHITEPNSVYNQVRKKFEKEPDYIHYVELFGSDEAKLLYRRHAKKLRNEQIKKREQHFLGKLPDAFQHFLPDLDTIMDRSLPTCMNFIKRRDTFDQYFIEVCDEGGSWKTSDFVDNYKETRIPFDLLNSHEAEACFRNHFNALQAEHKKLELKKDFRKLLVDNPEVTPGKPLNEKSCLLFVGKEAYNDLLEHERQQVYEEYQMELKANAMQDLQELLWEQTAVFMKLSASGRHMSITDYEEITTALQDDPRYIILERFEDDRKVCILNHLGFHLGPSKERCFYKEKCIETQVQKVLATREVKSESKEMLHLNHELERPLNLVLLGKDGLPELLNKEIRSLCQEDEYELRNVVYSLDYRPIDGDVSLEQNAFATANFKPDGCICVYSSTETLEYVRASLEQTFNTEFANSLDPALRSMPITIMQAYDPGKNDKAAEAALCSKGRQLANRLQCKFIDIPLEEDLHDSRKFYPPQVNDALTYITSPKNGANESKSQSTLDTPHIRIALCMMCGDQYSVNVPAAPLLNHDVCRVHPDNPNVVTIETFLDYKQRVEVTLMSYHGAMALKKSQYHGYILVYSAKRKASLATMKAFTETLPRVPLLILASADSGAAMFFTSECSKNLITEGNTLADKLGARFMTTTANFQNQAVYTPFFKAAWDKRDNTMAIYRKSAASSPHNAYESTPMSRRPPAPLPKSVASEIYHTGKSTSTSNSQSTDSEPIYEQTGGYIGPYHTDSEHERASSASPPSFSADYDPNIYNRIGGETNGEHVVRPSDIKKQSRILFAEQYKDRFRKSFPTADSDILRLKTALSMDQADAEVKPHYQFRKSSSMKLALKEDPEAGPGFAENDAYESAGPREEEVVWADNTAYDSQPIMGSKGKPGHLNMKQYQKVTNMISKNLRSHSKKMVSPGNSVSAPLAIPEPIEIADYGYVKDALNKRSMDNDYAMVDDALPMPPIGTRRKDKSKAESEESDISSLEREVKNNVYTKVNRKPTPKKKKHKPRSDDSQTLLEHFGRFPVQESFDQGRHYSPSEGSDGTGDEQLSSNKTEKKRRSVKTKKTRLQLSGARLAVSPPLSDSDILAYNSAKALLDENPYEEISPNNQPYQRFAEEGNFNGEGANRFDKYKIKDSEKLKKKEEKRIREEEKKKLKEEEKKQREQQRLQKKTKKKDVKSSQSQSCYLLEDYGLSTSNPGIPLLVEKCVQYVEKEGLTVEGIYRVPGNKAQVDILMSRFNEDANVDIDSLEIPVNAVGTALKQFFNDLADPLVLETLYDELMEAAGLDASSRLLALRGLLKKLPQQNHEILKYLIAHLKITTDHSSENSMTSVNLARCWWPTLIRMNFDSFEIMTQMTPIPEGIIQTLIEQQDFFFYDGDEVR